MTSISPKLPLAGLKVVEFAGLAPGPFVGMLLADFGADVVRIDRVGASLNPDSLCRGKRSIGVNPKSEGGRRVLLDLMRTADVVIDPFRPGVLERLGLGPQHVADNQRLVFARLTGYQRVGPYKDMAGHDINYVALSGVLSILGGQSGAPIPPANILGDFAGGSLMCLLGILLALFERSTSGKGQIVEADMVSGARYLSSFVLLTSYLEHPVLGTIMGDGTNERRGKGQLDGGSPWYGVYQCADGKWISVGAIEPQFYSVLLSTLSKRFPTPPASAGPHPLPKSQNDRETWPALVRYFTHTFAALPRGDWEALFAGTDACVAPVLTRDEALSHGYTPALPAELADGSSGTIVPPEPAPVLSRTPARPPVGGTVRRLAGGDAADDDAQLLLNPGEHTNEVLREWLPHVSVQSIRELWKSGAVGGQDEEEGLEGRRDSKL